MYHINRSLEIQRLVVLWYFCISLIACVPGLQRPCWPGVGFQNLPFFGFFPNSPAHQKWHYSTFYSYYWDMSKNNHTLDKFTFVQLLFTHIVRDIQSPRSVWWALRTFIKCFVCTSPSCVTKLFRLPRLVYFRPFSGSFCTSHHVDLCVFTNKLRFLCIIMHTIPSCIRREPIYCLSV